MNIFKKLAIALFALATCVASAEKLTEAQMKWHGLFKGMYQVVSPDGKKSNPAPFELEIGRTGSPGNVRLNFSNGSDNTLTVMLVNLGQRKNNHPPTITMDSFHLPAIFAEPIEFDARMVQGGFNEDLVAGTIITYKLSVDSEPAEEMRIEFKAGRL